MLGIHGLWMQMQDVLGGGGNKDGGSERMSEDTFQRGVESYHIGCASTAT